MHNPQITQPQPLKSQGKILNFERPLIMGILNITPDSFSDGGKFNTLDTAMNQVAHMVAAGADIVDIGGYSSRPGADHISEFEEIERIEEIVTNIIQRFSDLFISIDTFRAGVALKMLDLGVHIINDISATSMDAEMLKIVSSYNVPIVLMHMQGTPRDMQENPEYEDVVEEVFSFLKDKANEANEAGVSQVIIDPGFGFGKSLKHNYRLFRNLHRFTELGFPLMIGISRKSMIYKLVEELPENTDDLSAALHLQSLIGGANILRVHDVASAVKIRTLFLQLNG